MNWNMNKYIFKNILGFYKVSYRFVVIYGYDKVYSLGNLWFDLFLFCLVIFVVLV